MEYFVHQTAVIDANVHIGAGTHVWHFCHIMPGVVLGNNCNIGQNVFIDKNVIIGNGVKVQNNVSLYTGVTCEDDVFIGPSVVFTNVVNPRSFIERKHEFKPTLVQRGATIGANATIVCGVTIGSYALVGAGAVITKTVKPYALVAGNPAKAIGWVSKAGKKLLFDEQGNATCSETGEQYILQNETVQPL